MYTSVSVSQWEANNMYIFNYQMITIVLAFTNLIDQYIVNQYNYSRIIYKQVCMYIHTYIYYLYLIKYM